MRIALIAAVLVLVFYPLHALGCEPGTSECAGTSSYRTCTEQAIWGEPIDCQSGYLCSEGACTPQLGCKPGARECLSDATYRVCSNMAIWGSEQYCPTGATCNAGSCFAPQCNPPGQTRCSPDNSNLVQICNGDLQWDSYKTCDYGCTNGYCRDCRPGNTRCYDNTHYQQCGNDGTWGSSNYCGQNLVCDGGSCITNPQLVCQSIGAFRCSPTDSMTLQRCNSNSRWGDYQYCSLGCFYGACRVCSTGERKCKDSASYYMCNDKGQWSSETSCPNGYVCFSGSCQVMPDSQCSSPGAKRCSPTDSNEVQTCNSNYAYVDYQQCALGCFNGICAECKPQASVCSGPTSFKTCSANGQLSDSKQCSQGYTCEDGACVATPKCTAGQRQCISGAVYQCLNNSWAMLYLCPQDTDCKEEQGTAYCVAEQKSGAGTQQQNQTQQPSSQQQQGGQQPSPQPLSPENKGMDAPSITVIVFGAFLLGVVAAYYIAKNKLIPKRK